MKTGERIAVMRGGLPFIGEYHVISAKGHGAIIADDTRHTEIMEHETIYQVNPVKLKGSVS